MTKVEDFGFTFDEAVDPGAANEKAAALMNKITPFLERLKGNKEHDVIKWEGAKRIKQIENFIKELEGIAYD